MQELRSAGPVKNLEVRLNLIGTTKELGAMSRDSQDGVEIMEEVQDLEEMEEALVGVVKKVETLDSAVEEIMVVGEAMEATPAIKGGGEVEIREEDGAATADKVETKEDGAKKEAILAGEVVAAGDSTTLNHIIL